MVWHEANQTKNGERNHETVMKFHRQTLVFHHKILVSNHETGDVGHVKIGDEPPSGTKGEGPSSKGKTGIHGIW